jgi:hypothetical protein
VNTALAEQAEPVTEPGPESPHWSPDPAWLWARDVAALLAAQTGQDAKVETITQYVWLRGKHIRDHGQAKPGDIPAPDDHARPPWRVSGALYPRWAADGPIREWIASRQPPGRPRNDDQPRTRRKDRYETPGRRPARG